MNTKVIIDLWNFRAKLNAVVSVHCAYDSGLFSKEEYAEIFDNAREELDEILVEMIKNSPTALTSYYRSFSTDALKRQHTCNNAHILQQNFEAYRKKYVDKKLDVETRFTQDKDCLAFEIFVLSSMFDRFKQGIRVRNEMMPLQTCSKQQLLNADEKNMTLAQAILSGLKGIHANEFNQAYSNEIGEIISMVYDTYHNQYGYRRPKIDYNELSKEF